MGAGKDELDVRESVIDDALKDRVYRCGVVHCFEVGILVNDNDQLLRQRIEVGEYILQRIEAQRHG